MVLTSMMRPLLSISVVAVSLLACGPDAAGQEGWTNPSTWASDAPTTDQVEEKLGPPVAIRSEPPVEVWTYCGERKEDGHSFRIWPLEVIQAAHGTCMPQLEMTFVSERLSRIEQIDHPAIDYANPS